MMCGCNDLDDDPDTGLCRRCGHHAEQRDGDGFCTALGVDLAGTVLDLPAEAWKNPDGPLRLRVHRIMRELNRYYGGQWAWLEGERLNAAPDRGRWIQVLVRVDALVLSGQDPGHP